MPGVFTHFLALDGIASGLGKPWSSAIASYPEFAAFGSVGPDYLYFYKNDWGPAGQIGHVYFSIMDDLKDIINLHNTVVEAQGNVSDWLSGGLQSALEANVQLVKSTIAAKIASLITSSSDFFEAFSPPIATRPEEASIKQWWWADIAHQHRTTDFARELWRKSKTDDSLRAYTFGYLSHIATDVVGHPLINLYSGGPYRNHWRRHNLIERILDSDLWQRKNNRELVEDAVYRRIHFPGRDSDVPEIPGKLCDFLAQAYKVTYGALGIASGVPNSDDIREMYVVYYRYLKSATSNSLLNQLRPPEDFEWFDLDDWIREKFDSVFSKQPGRGRLPTLDPDDPRSWLAYILSLAEYLIWLTEVCVTVATILVAAGARLATAPARYLLWKLSLALYEMYDTARLLLVMAGYLHPTSDHVRQYFQHIASKQGQSSFVKNNLSFTHATNSEQTYHLIHPSLMRNSTSEEPLEPIIRSLRSPDFEELIFGRVGPVDKERITSACRSHDEDAVQFGVIDFAQFLADQFDQNAAKYLPNLNLDGDRGFSWPSWTTADQLPWTNQTKFMRCPTL